MVIVSLDEQESLLTVMSNVCERWAVCWGDRVGGAREWGSAMGTLGSDALLSTVAAGESTMLNKKEFREKHRKSRRRAGSSKFKAVREVEEDDEVDASFHLPSLAGILLLVLTPQLVSSLVTLWRSRTSP